MNIKDCFSKMYEQAPSLFSQKAMYLLNHTVRGGNRLFRKLPKHIQRRMKCDNMHLIGNMRFTEENGFPILAPFTHTCFEFDVYSYKDRNKHGDGPWAVHFFQHDYSFIHAVTDNLEVTTRALVDCDIVFAPDCSLYVDAPVFINKQNIFRSRFAAAYWQSCGYNVIQTASWGDADSLSYCFEGLAENSVTAVCGIGHDHCKQANHLWVHAINNLIAQKSPCQLIIYGGKNNNIPNFGIPIVFIEDHISKHLR